MRFYLQFRSCWISKLSSHFPLRVVTFIIFIFPFFISTRLNNLVKDLLNWLFFTNSDHFVKSFTFTFFVFFVCMYVCVYARTWELQGNALSERYATSWYFFNIWGFEFASWSCVGQGLYLSTRSQDNARLENALIMQ